MLSEQLSRASIPLAHLDDVLRNGGNRNGSSLRVIARYAKGKSAEENAEFLRREYGRGGKGFIFGTERLSVWFDEPGLRVGRGRSALGARDAALVSWEQAADRIGELLTAGQYASRDDLERAPAFERRELAESLWVLHQDTAGEFFLDESLFQGGFPESTERIAALLGQPEQLESVLSGLRGFCAAYEKNPELLRFRIHDPKALSQRLTDLQKQPIVFPAMDLPNPAFERFITEDEIDAFLTRGGPVSDGKYRIFSYFLSGHSVKEQAALLRDEYGTGGSTGALSGADDSYADYSPKGLVLARGPISNPYDKIKLSWSKAAERVSRLIFSGRYMSRAELGRIPDYEKRVLATEIHSFFINLPKKIQRPYEGNAFDSTGIDQVMEKLGNPARVDEILGMMKPVLENTAPDDRSFKIRSAACRHTQEFRDGAFTLFPHLSLVPTPEEGFAAAPAPALSEPDDEQPPEQLSLFPDENQQQYTAIRAESQQAAPNLNVQPTARTGDTIENGVILHHVVLTLSGGQRENAQRTTDSDAISLPYQVGDTVYLDDKPFEITGIGNVDVQLRDPALSYPIFRAESRENFERLLRRDSRNGPMTDFLATDLKHVDADLREALTSGLLGQEDKQTLAGLFRSREGNARVARWLSETCAGTAETMELITGETADFFADTKGFEVEIHDKYNSRRSASWERIAPILRALYQRELDGFSHEPVLREPVAPSTEVKPPEPAAQPSGSPRPENGAPVPEEAAAVSSPGETAAEKPVSVQPKPRNFHITDDNLGVGGAKTKYAYNIAAIRTLKTIEAEGRTATPEEQETLSRYVGWGGLPQAFDKDNADWKKEYAELKDALTDREYESARASTLNAHYTSPTVIRAIYEAVGNFGFQTGNILEPACGVGNFFGLLPESMAASRLYGVELDSITGRIARQLYPNADITLAGFETTDRRDFFDLAVGNVPFGSYKVPDRAYDKLGFPIHDYFFAKTLDQVRPGGVIAFVTSHYTMDKRSPDVRRYLAQRADLLGAIRLPSTAFKANAGTEVTTDIVFLQKRDRPIDIEPDWVHLSQTEDGIPVNSYFADHPEMVLGTVKWDDRMYGDKMETACEAFPGADFSAQLHEAVSHIQGQITGLEQDELREAQSGSGGTLAADPNVKNYSYTVFDGEVYYRENSRMVKPDLSDTAKERVKGMVELRDCVQNLIGQQLDEFVSDAAIRQTQAELNTLYDAFTAKYGLISSRGNSLAFAEDSSYYLLCSLEVLDEDGNLERKADMFTRRTIRQHKVVTSVDTASEALALSIAEKARVDMDYMASLTGKTPDELAGELKGVIFRDLGEQDPASVPKAFYNLEKIPFVTADEYLSGNVRRKLRLAKALAEMRPDLAEKIAPNIEALKAAQPKDLDASEIEVRLGATWIGRESIQQFMEELLEPPYNVRDGIRVNYSEFTAEWNISGKSSVGYNNVAAHVTYGTERASAYRILEDSLNLRDVRIYDTVEDADGKERRVLNSKETTLAQQKQQAVKDAFREWIWKDPERRQALTKKYNELFNSFRPREYDGRYLTFPGMNPEITLRDHQLNAVAHQLYGGNTLLAHEVGAGKSATRS